MLDSTHSLKGLNWKTECTCSVLHVGILSAHCVFKNYYAYVPLRSTYIDMVYWCY